MRLVLPFPPSTNSLYKNLRSGGRARTVKYSSWQQAALYYLVTCHPNHKTNGDPVFPGEYGLKIQLTKPQNMDGRTTRRRFDLDNHVKAIADFLVATRITGDDSNLRYLVMLFDDVETCPEGSMHGKGGTALVTVATPEEIAG